MIAIVPNFGNRVRQQDLPGEPTYSFELDDDVYMLLKLLVIFFKVTIISYVVERGQLSFCRPNYLVQNSPNRFVMLTHFVSLLADKILSDIQGPQRISHRILAQLLFGIVRIYSKKVYYLYRDCEEVRTLHLKQCTEPSAPTGGLTRGVLKQVNRAVRGERSVVGHQNKSKVKKPVHAVRTEVSSPISTEGFSVTVETEVIVRTSVVIREAYVTNDLPTFTIPERFELDCFDLGISEDT